MGMDRVTLADYLKQTNPDGTKAKIAETMTEKSRILRDAPTYPSNSIVGNRVTIRSSLPTVQAVKVNQGITRSKGSTRQEVNTMTMIQGRSEVDKRWIKIVGKKNFNKYRMSRDKSFLESIAQSHVNYVLYGDEDTDAAGFTGLATRMSTLATSIYGSQVRSMGSVAGGDGTSILVVDWGEDGASFIHPMDDEDGAGVDSEDLGMIDVPDADGNNFSAFVTEYTLITGLNVADPRRTARLANIDRSDAMSTSPTQGLLYDELTKIFNSMPSPVGFQRILYTHRDIITALEIQAKNTAKHVTIEEYMGEKVPHVRGFPVHTLDRMSGAESTVS